MDYNNTSITSFDQFVSAVMRRVYVKMFLALLITAVTSLYVATSESLQTMLFTSTGPIVVIMLLEVALVIAISAAINRLSMAMASFLFYFYSILNGVLMASIFFVYTIESIWLTFMITAGVFAAMSIYGYVTKSDLTKIGSYLFMALIGSIIASIVNIFAHSDTLGYLISYAGVAIFIGLTAWDTQKIKRMALTTPGDQAGKLATIGALSLYLDFINLFIYLLRIFGNRSK